MDRYVIREVRPSAANQQQSQMIALPSTSRDDNNVTLLESENAYYGGYGPVFPNAQRIHNPCVIIQNPRHTESVINPRYLAAYPESGTFITGQQQIQGQQHIPAQGQQKLQGQQYIQRQQNIQGQQNIHRQLNIQEQQQIQTQQYIQGQQYMQKQQYIQVQQNVQALQNFQGQQHFQADLNLQSVIPETTDAVVYTKYMNKNFVGAEKPSVKRYVNVPQFTSKEKPPAQVFASKQSSFYGHTSASMTNKEDAFLKTVAMPLKEQTNKAIDTIVAKNEAQSQRKSRFDRLEALNKSGPRAFSGPVEKVLKWHKALQEVGVLILYEIVAKCLSVTQGKPCEKILVIRDENGPAMQVVYCEIDFLLPELTLPCTVRVVGRMLVGTSRLQAFSVRMATEADIATLPRRAAVAQHHVAKLCKEYISQ